MRYVCRLAGWRHTCAEGYQDHHLISKGDLRGNTQARRYVEKAHPEVFLIPVCGFANRSRLTDTKEGTALLLQRQIELFGRDYVAEVWVGLLSLFESRAGLQMDALLAHLPPDDPGPLW